MADKETKRARTGNITDKKYLAVYPHAETNADRAEEMAYASRSHEEALVHAGKLAKLAARNDKKALLRYRQDYYDEISSGDSFVGNLEKPYLMDESRAREIKDADKIGELPFYVERAKALRSEADQLANQAGKEYDRQVRFVDSVDDKMDRLMSGKALD